MSNDLLDNQIFRCRQIRSTFDYKTKNITTYLNNIQKVCDIFVLVVLGAYKQLIQKNFLLNLILSRDQNNIL